MARPKLCLLRHDNHGQPDDKKREKHRKAKRENDENDEDSEHMIVSKFEKYAPL